MSSSKYEPHNDDDTLFEAFRLVGAVLLGIIVLFAVRMMVVVAVERFRYDTSYRKEFLCRIFPWMISSPSSLSSLPYVDDTIDVTNWENINNINFDTNLSSNNNNSLLAFSNTIHEYPSIRVSLPLQKDRQRYEDLYKDIIEKMLPGTPWDDKNLNRINSLMRWNNVMKKNHHHSQTKEDMMISSATTTSSSTDSLSLDVSNSMNNNQDIENKDSDNASTHAIDDNLTLKCNETTRSNIILDDEESQLNKTNNNIPDNDDDNEVLCSICMNGMIHDESIYIVESCHHIFHIDCIRQWVSKSPSLTYCTTTNVSVPPSSHININNNNNNNDGGTISNTSFLLPSNSDNNNNNNNNNINTIVENNNNNNNNNNSIILPYHCGTILNLYINNDCPNCRTPVFMNPNIILNIIQNCKLQFVADCENSNLCSINHDDININNNSLMNNENTSNHINNRHNDNRQNIDRINNNTTTTNDINNDADNNTAPNSMSPNNSS